MSRNKLVLRHMAQVPVQASELRICTLRPEYPCQRAGDHEGFEFCLVTHPPFSSYVSSTPHLLLASSYAGKLGALRRRFEDYFEVMCCCHVSLHSYPSAPPHPLSSLLCIPLPLLLHPISHPPSETPETGCHFPCVCIDRSSRPTKPSVQRCGFA